MVDVSASELLETLADLKENRRLSFEIDGLIEPFVGKTYDLSDVSIWRRWMPLVGVPALFLLPRPAASSAKTTNPLGRRISLGLLALYVVLVPAIASMIQAAIDLSDTGSSGYG